MVTLKIQDDAPQTAPTLMAIGVGGGGSNAVKSLFETAGIECLVCNTDAQALANSPVERKVQLGPNITRGLGAGARPEVGRAAAEEVIEELAGYMEGANMVFITAGMGGGTGTGASSVIARTAREMGILTVGVVTKPFSFEGSRRMRQAEAGIEELQQYVDTLLVIPNQNLFRLANAQTTFSEAFQMADQVLHDGVRGITDLMVRPGLVNLDFADVRTVMAEMGKAMMGTGEAEGEQRAMEAAEAAIANPLLDDVSMKGAKAVLINITGGMDVMLYEIDEACNRIREEVDPEANIIFGSSIDSELEGKLRISIVATGIDNEGLVQQRDDQEKAPSQEDINSFFARRRQQLNAGFGGGRSAFGGGNRSATVHTGGQSGQQSSGQTGTQPQQSSDATRDSQPMTGTSGAPSANAASSPQGQDRSQQTVAEQSSAPKMSAQQHPSQGQFFYQQDGNTVRKVEHQLGHNEETVAQTTAATQSRPDETVQDQRRDITEKSAEATPQYEDVQSSSDKQPKLAAETDNRMRSSSPQSPEPAERQGGSLLGKLMGRGQSRDTGAQGPRVVVENNTKESSDGDLDIPAFLRRQAN